MNIQKRTVRSLRAAAANFFPDDDAYHVWIGAQYGVESTLELSNSQGREAAKAVNQMKRDLQKRKAGFDSAQPTGSNRLSQAQLMYIEGLFKACGIPRGKRQQGFIRKQTGKTKIPEWLTNREASKVITGLKKMADGASTTLSNQLSSQKPTNQ